MYITDPTAVKVIAILVVIFFLYTYAFLIRYVIDDRVDFVLYTIVFSFGIIGVLFGGGVLP
jgi:hypothetical protein